ncbi:MAG: RpiB/LacA/LacB family sugar-phosphate isomerase [Parcubacteria group bacterium]|nr:RpiB/LacA/LacB family sugar-phosphate isomerase [Parcubacteria group bacterium]
MKIYLGTDHAGFELKEKIKTFLLEKGHEVKDFGAFSLDPDDDYPDFIRPVAEAVAQDKESRGIILGGSGQGEAMVANRVSGIRATVYYGGNHEIIKLSREHNDANVLSLGVRFLTEDEAISMITLWLSLPFSGEERHERRIEKLDIK